MAIKTPARPTEPAQPLDGERARWEAVETTAETASRAVRPPTVVEHQRLPERT
ncbi:small CPxCG-related zinc finger protein, partial [Haloferax sp. BAB-2207]